MATGEARMKAVPNAKREKRRFVVIGDRAWRVRTDLIVLTSRAGERGILEAQELAMLDSFQTRAEAEATFRRPIRKKRRSHG